MAGSPNDKSTRGTVRAVAANPRLLVWARQTAGLSINEVAERIGKTPDDVKAWESHEKSPTFKQLEALAETVYRRPVALFFLPEPPTEKSPAREFRTLPGFEIENLSADTRYALRVARSYQDSLRDLTAGRNPAARLITVDLKAHGQTNPTQLAQAARQYLGVGLKEQQGWKDSRTALTEWRSRLETAGVFVFKRSLSQKEISGFSLFDETFPVVLVNNSTPFTRQIFTLFHELGHLLFGVSSITKLDAGFTDRLPASARAVEIACNRFAAEFLLPEDSFPWHRVSADNIEHATAEISKLYHVSREVVLRRFLDRQIVDRERYLDLSRTWIAEAARKGGEGGGNYYLTQAAYLGRPFLELVFSRSRAGLLSLPEAAEHLGVKARYLSKLESYVFPDT